MKIIISLKDGMLRSVKAWKPILIVWVCYILLAGIVAIPMKSVVKAGLGKSMITEKLADGFNFEVFADMGAHFGGISSYLASGLLMIGLAGFILSSFLSGGLFNSLRKSSPGFSSDAFSRSSSGNFWSFLVISLITWVIILILAVVVIVIPVSIVAASEESGEGTIYRIGIIASSFFLLAVTLMFLVADYSRAWQVLHERNNCFKAIGFGFRQAFRAFSASYPLMLIIFLIQLLYGWFVFSVLSVIRPDTEMGIIILFILSQVLFIIKIILKVWRYASVTSMMELTAGPS